MEKKKYFKPKLKTSYSEIEDILLISMTDDNNDIFDYDEEF